MKLSFYPRLAWDGIRKNKRLQVPYIFTGSVMVMMHYILGFLVESPAVSNMSGGSVMMTMLPLGKMIVAVFSALFLFYTNSFLVKQRYREFGLYNILGMDKRNICKVMLWETIYVAMMALAVGLAAGLLLSKAAELVLLNIMQATVSYALSIGFAALGETTLLFAGIYLLLFCYSLFRVGISKPLELMQSSRVGERVPRRTWLFALVGVTLLGLAYWLAVSIRDPLDAYVWFFIAVLMVIVGTYLVFIAGSVVFCRLLQRNKSYYYKPNHFVSVSTMVYRMKRNGAGLASICILLTMVLVMISSTTCLYFGVDDSLRAKCPYDINLSLYYSTADGIGEENLTKLRDMLRTHSGSADLSGVRSCELYGSFTAEGFVSDTSSRTEDTDNVGYLTVLSLEDYNRATGSKKTLSPGECLLYCDNEALVWDSFTVELGDTYRVKERLADFIRNGEATWMVMPMVYLVVEDIMPIAEPYTDREDRYGETVTVFGWQIGFDTDSPAAEEAAMADIQDWLTLLRMEDRMLNHTLRGRAEQKEHLFDMYGSLFFLGLMLSLVFLLAAVLIIYYKQISEGYEDCGRFDIMQKVGMTKRDIRGSINAQMLTVFFLPLVLAGVHLGFAFPFVDKIFRIFSFDNTMLSIVVNVVCFGVFGGIYALVYKVTSGAYYVIVSGKK